MNCLIRKKCFKNVLYTNLYKNVYQQFKFNKRQYSIPNPDPKKNEDNNKENNSSEDDDNTILWIIIFVIIINAGTSNRNSNRY